MPTTRKKKTTEAQSTDSHLSLADVAYEALKLKILTLEFEPGSYLNESAAAKALNIGRNPIHHAVKKLVFEGLVEIIPRKGIIIKPVQISEILEIADARIINEAYCVRKAAEQSSRPDIDHMKKILKKSATALKANDTKAQMFLDRDFHCAIFHTAGNSVLEAILRNLHERSLRSWFISLREPGQAAGVYEQHLAILTAIEAHDSDKAEQQMIHHIGASRSALVNRF